MTIYPSILSDSIEIVQQQLFLANSLEGVEAVQLDIIDGYYADNMTVTPADLLGLEFGELEIDFHLMVEEPINFLHEIIEFKEDLPVLGVIAQIERMGSQQEFLDLCLDHDLEGGLSVDYFTPITEMDVAALSSAKKLQLMAIEAGFQGQEFCQPVFTKIQQATQLLKLEQLEPELIVDGGVKQRQLQELSQLGVNAVAIGSWLWKNNKPQTVVDIVINS